MNHRHDLPPPPTDGHRSTHAYLCTGCPLGCRLEVDAVDDQVVEVRGFSCRKGERYGRQEYLDPRRPLSTTVWIEGAAIRRVPVRTAEPIPRDQLRAVVEALRGLTIAAPVRRGEVVAADVLGSGIDVIVTRDLPRLPRHGHPTHDGRGAHP
jgi:CxxC motif-containing protein